MGGLGSGQGPDSLHLPVVFCLPAVLSMVYVCIMQCTHTAVDIWNPASDDTQCQPKQIRCCCCRCSARADHSIVTHGVPQALAAETDLTTAAAQHCSNHRGRKRCCYRCACTTGDPLWRERHTAKTPTVTFSMCALTCRPPLKQPTSLLAARPANRLLVRDSHRLWKCDMSHSETST